MRHSVRLSLAYSQILFGIWGGTAALAESGDRASAQSAQAAATDLPSPELPADAPPKSPQAAFDACKTASEGDACSVSFDGHTMTGTCRKGPSDEAELACVPDHPSGPPPSGSEHESNRNAYAACSDARRFASLAS
jgi:hypothetical protein